MSRPGRELNSQSNIGFDGKRLRVTTRCVRPAMLGPASAGVGVRVPRLFGHGPISSLDGGQLAQAPQDYAVDGVTKTVLEFDVAKILLHVKDRLEKAPGPDDYSIAPPSAVFHIFNEDMELFSSARCCIDVTLRRIAMAEACSKIFTNMRFS